MNSSANSSLCNAAIVAQTPRPTPLAICARSAILKREENKGQSFAGVCLPPASVGAGPTNSTGASTSRQVRIVWLKNGGDTRRG
jgi:hypothetical protein